MLQPLRDSSMHHHKVSEPHPQEHLPKQHCTEEVQAQADRVFAP